VISYHNGSVSKALLDLFPEIGLDKFKMGISRWVDINNRRDFFEKYAKEKGFDPLHSSLWYLQPKSQIMAQKVPINHIPLLILLGYPPNKLTNRRVQ